MIYGFGINDIKGSTRDCPIYKIWVSMLARCYSEKVHKRQPKYVGCSVCDEWLTFSNFKLWVESQNWHGLQLDKDVINPGNKVYSPESCRFVSRRVNSILTFRKSKNSKYMIGVFLNDSKANTFRAQIGFMGKVKTLGTYNTELEAHAAYVNEKIKQIYDLASQSEPDIASGLIKHAMLIESEFNENGFLS